MLRNERLAKVPRSVLAVVAALVIVGLVVGGFVGWQIHPDSPTKMKTVAAKETTSPIPPREQWGRMVPSRSIAMSLDASMGLGGWISDATTMFFQDSGKLSYVSNDKLSIVPTPPKDPRGGVLVRKTSQGLVGIVYGNTDDTWCESFVKQSLTTAKLLLDNRAGDPITLIRPDRTYCADVSHRTLNAADALPKPIKIVKAGNLPDRDTWSKQGITKETLPLDLSEGRLGWLPAEAVYGNDKSTFVLLTNRFLELNPKTDPATNPGGGNVLVTRRNGVLVGKLYPKTGDPVCSGYTLDKFYVNDAGVEAKAGPRKPGTMAFVKITAPDGSACQ